MTGTCLTISFSVILDEAELDALESLRLRRRLSSQAETIRELIRCGLREEAWEAFDIVGPR
jgi:metal-responsive CopG/Arc/MetJ family transcriptional regulator